MEKISINGSEYPATIYGSIKDHSWDERESKSIILTMNYSTAAQLFVDNVEWSIISEWEQDGQIMREEYDNSDYSIAGDITDHRDGTLTIKMGKPTDLELAYELLYGAKENE